MGCLTRTYIYASMILGAGFIWCLPTLLRKGGEAHYENQNFHNKSVKAHLCNIALSHSIITRCSYYGTKMTPSTLNN